MARTIPLVILSLHLSFNLHAVPLSPDEFIDSLMVCVSQEHASREKVDCLVELAYYYREINGDSAVMYSDQAYTLARLIGYTEGAAEAVYKKSLTLAITGDYLEAIKYAEMFLAICDSIHDSVRMAKGYFNLGNLIRIGSDREASLEYYKRAKVIYERLKDSLALLSVYNGIGNFYKEIPVYDSAVTYYHKSIGYCEAIGFSSRLGRIIGNLGDTYIKLDDFENARKYLLIGLDYDLRNKDYISMSVAYSRLGNLAHFTGDYDEAMNYYLLADSLYRMTGDLSGLHDNLVNIGYQFLKLEKFDDALACFRKGLAHHRTQDYSEGIMAAWQGITKVFREKGQTGKSLLYADSTLALARSTNNLHRQKNVLHEIYIICFNAGETEKALQAFTEYHAIRDSIFNLERTRIINELLLRYEKDKDRLQILSLEKENLEKERQRNRLIFAASGILLLALFITLFLVYKRRKDRIIASQRIRRLEEEKKHMAARFLVEGQELERKRVALELHDNLGVLLTATRLHFSEIRDKEPGSRELIGKAEKLLEQASSDVRKISHNLMPGLLTRLGLFEALEDLFESLIEKENFDSHLEVIGEKGRLDENKEIMIYRIVQELVNNTIKHAGATVIDLTIVNQDGELSLSYHDNGKGFDVKKTLDLKTMGLQSIQSRVKFLNGTIRIDSMKNNGTVFLIFIPVGHQPPSCK
jgi:two-component system, NarL family, sensor kinase